MKKKREIQKRGYLVPQVKRVRRGMMKGTGMDSLDQCPVVESQELAGSPTRRINKEKKERERKKEEGERKMRTKRSKRRKRGREKDL